MKNDLSNLFGQGFSRGLAGVSAKDEKQSLSEVVVEVGAGVNMACGLQGKGDWESAAVKIEKMAKLLAENTKSEEIRKEAGSIAAASAGAFNKLSSEDPTDARNLIRQLGNSLLKAAGINKDGTPWSDPAVKPLPPMGPLAGQATAGEQTETTEKCRPFDGAGVLEKGAPAQPGETRTWGGAEYAKQPDGSWKHKGASQHPGQLKRAGTPQEMHRLHMSHHGDAIREHQRAADEIDQRAATHVGSPRADAASARDAARHRDAATKHKAARGAHEAAHDAVNMGDKGAADFVRRAHDATAHAISQSEQAEGKEGDTKRRYTERLE